jgi:acetyltransferase
MAVHPAQLEHVIHLRDGATLCIRPLAADDASALTDLFDHLTPEDVRARFFVTMRELPPALLARLTHVEHDHEMALAAFHPDVHGTLCGVVRLSADADDRRRAEFAVVVRSDWKRRGLGHALIQEIVGSARDRAVSELYGLILAENAPMIALARKLGFTIAANPDDARQVIARLRLPAPAAAR